MIDHRQVKSTSPSIYRRACSFLCDTHKVALLLRNRKAESPSRKPATARLNRNQGESPSPTATLASIAVVERSDTTARDHDKTSASWRDARIIFGIRLVQRIVERDGRLWIVCDPSGIDISSGGGLTGGVASLNHRLITVILPG